MDGLFAEMSRFPTDDRLAALVDVFGHSTFRQVARRHLRLRLDTKLRDVVTHFADDSRHAFP